MSDYIDERNGGYYVAGTRVSLDSVVYMFRDGSSPETIQENFNSLTLPQVYRTIAFYLDNREKVEEYLQKQKQKWADAEASGTPLKEWNPDLWLRVERARASMKSRES
jgi:uncharacterized protein (DUF433 family)